MSEKNERPAAEDTSSAASLTSGTSGPGIGGGREAEPETQLSNQATDAAHKALCPGDEPREALNQRLEETRLPADLKEQILAELLPPEERERLYRELQEKGGMSFEEFFQSVTEVERQP